MTLHIPVNGAQVSCVWTFTGSSVRATTSFGIQTVDGPDLEAVATQLRDAWVANLQDITSSLVTFASIDSITPTTASTFPVNLAGDSTAFDTDTYEAVVLKKAGGGRGRVNQGRMYWPGLLSAGNVGIDGTIAPGTVSAIQDVIDAFWGDFTTALPDYDMLILHTDPDLPPTDFGGLVVGNRIGIQRRRRAKRSTGS